MKIFLVSNMYPSEKYPDFGVFVKNFREKLSEKGLTFNRVSVIDQKSKGYFKKLIIYTKYYYSIFKNYIKTDFEIIYIHFISHNAPIFFILISLFKKRVPIVINVHGSDIVKYNKGHWRWFNEYLLNNTDLIIVPSSYFKGVVIDNFPFYESNNIFVYPSGGINTKVFYPLNLNGDSNKPIFQIGFVSRIEEGKGWDLYLEALAHLKSNMIKFKAIIGGDGSQVEKMLYRIKELHLIDEIEYLGVVKQDELMKIYNNLDIFVFCSILPESLGLVGLEAMACGVPIIASNKAGPKSYVINDTNGFLVQPGESIKITEALMKYYNLSKEAKNNMKINALNTSKEYDSEMTAHNLTHKLFTLRL